MIGTLKLTTFKSLGGNAAIKRVYGKNKTDHSKPSHQIDEFIRAKYVKKAFAKRKEKKKTEKIKRKKHQRPKQREQKKNKSKSRSNSLESDPKLWESFEDSDDSNKENASSNDMIPDLIGSDQLENFNFLSDLTVIADDKEQMFDAVVFDDSKLKKRAILSKYNENRPNSWIQFEATPRRVSNDLNQDSFWSFDEPKFSLVAAPQNNKVMIDYSDNDLKEDIIPIQVDVPVSKPKVSKKRKANFEKKLPMEKVKVKKQKSIKAFEEEKTEKKKSFNPWSYIDDLCNYDGRSYE